MVLVVLWVMLLIAAASNGVNLTDGLDGLAAGACVMIFGAYTLVNIWQYNQSCAYVASAGPKCYEVRDPYDLAVVAIALAGACFGFLWWNAEPAKIFMGDTGSLSLGGALAGMAIFTRTELLLIILGGLLVIEVMSVVLQVGYFKLTKGKRIFKMSPIHHHFELLNWAQVTIVMRFWIIAGLFVAAGLGIFYAEWVAGGVTVCARRGPAHASARVREGVRLAVAALAGLAATGARRSPSSPWPQAHVVVAGIGVSGFAAADGLLQLGARVTVLDDAATEANTDKGALLEVLGATVRLGPGLDRRRCPTDADLVITTGFPPTAPLLVQAARAAASPIWSEVELAWRLSRPAKVVPWLGITGTNGKTTTTQMLESMLAAAGLRTAAVGNIGRPLMEIVLDPEPYDVLAVELSSHQLHWSHSLALHSAAVLNLQPDHLEWHGCYEAYGAAKAKIYEGVAHSCVYNVADPATEAMVEEADVVEGARAIGFTLGIPGPSMLGVVDDLLVDRAFIEQRRDSALELAKIARRSARRPTPRTTSPTPWPPPPWPGRTGSPRPRSATGCAAVRVGAHKIADRGRARAASAGSTTPRRPTRTPPTPRCARSAGRATRR